MINNERIICCCGASTWTKVMACFQIVVNLIFIILDALALSGVTAKLNEIDDELLKNLVIAAGAIALAVAAFGFLMGIILLIGTIQKRIGFLQAWVIYAVISIIILAVSFLVSLLNVFGGKGKAIDVFVDAIGIAVTAFCIFIVRIRVREIREAGFVWHQNIQV